MSQTEKRLNLNGREIILVGTAHISKESIDQSVEVIRTEMPDCVAIELDEGRYESMKNPESWKNLDIVQVLKEGKGFVLMANLVLSSFQKRMGADVGVKPGDEMKAAITVAEELNIPCEMVDRPIQTTLRRAWGKNNLWGKCKLLATLISTAFTKEEVSPEQIEQLKNSNEMDSMMAELAEYLPTVKEVLIDERDQYRWIDQNLDKPIDLRSLEQHLNVSRSTLGRIFRKGKTVSPKEYWIRRRLAKSEYLLNHSEYSIKEISFQLGYSSQFHFSNEFRRFYGLSPLAYRKLGQN